MEERNKTSKLVFITGPESTGKTELAKELAKHYNAKWVPEFAREYVEGLSVSYNYFDVEEIAKKQINQIHKAIESNDLTFFDTGLIITKVWFDVVFKKCPDWLISEILNLPPSIHLLCAPDLLWQDDPVRENGGEMRTKLFSIYMKELEQFGFDYYLVKGIGQARTSKAIESLDKYF